MGWNKENLVREAGLLAVSGFGWTESKAPPIDPKAVGMMGLKKVPGLNIVRKEFAPRGPGNGQVGTSRNVHAGVAS